MLRFVRWLICCERSKEGVQTTSIELATKILDSKGKSRRRRFRSGFVQVRTMTIDVRAHSKYSVT